MEFLADSLLTAIHTGFFFYLLELSAYRSCNYTIANDWNQETHAQKYHEWIKEFCGSVVRIFPVSLLHRF